MTTLREAAQLALEALDAGIPISPRSVLHDRFRAALAQQDEPCPNCASLEAQNTELDRKLAELEQAYENGHKAGVAAEREACAKVCEEPGWNAANWCAKAIRARGNT